MTKEIALSRGIVTVVDDEDFEWLSNWKWSAVEGRHGCFYAQRGHYRMDARGRPMQTMRQMQREVLDPWCSMPRHILADHIDRNPLNNRRSNLRWANYSVSNLNRRPQKSHGKSSAYIGVYFCQTKGLFMASLRISDGRTVQRRCSSEEVAARVYDQLAKQHRGSHAVLNFPDAMAAE